MVARLDADYVKQLNEARAWWVAEERLSRVIQSMGSDVDDALALDAAFARWDRCEAIFGIQIADQLRLEAEASGTNSPPAEQPAEPTAGETTIAAAPSAARPPAPKTPPRADVAPNPTKAISVRPEEPAIDEAPAASTDPVATPLAAKTAAPPTPVDLPMRTSAADTTPLDDEPSEPATPAPDDDAATATDSQVAAAATDEPPLVEGFLTATNDRVPGSVVPEQFVSKRQPLDQSERVANPLATRVPKRAPIAAKRELDPVMRRRGAVYMALGLALIGFSVIGGLFALRARTNTSSDSVTAAAVTLTQCGVNRASADVINPFDQPATFDVLVEFSDASSELFPAIVRVNVGADETAAIDVPIGGVVLDETSLRCTAVVTRVEVG